MTHHPLPNQHYKPSIFYLSLYLLIILLSQFICSNTFNPPPKNTSITAKSGFKTYTSSEDNLSFQYPANWQVNSSDSGIDISEPQSTHLVNIKVIKDQPHPEQLISDWEKSPFYKINSDSPLKISNLKTLELLDDSSNSDHTQYLLYATQDNQIIEVTFLSNNPTRTETIARILSSIKFIKPPTPSPTSAPYMLFQSDSGKTISFGLNDRFAITLDSNKYPLSHIIVCPQISWISNLSVNGPDNYPIGYETTLPGTCIIKNGNFSITLKISD